MERNRLILKSMAIAVSMCALTPRTDAEDLAIELTNTDAASVGYVRIPDSDSLEPQRFTIEAWVTPQGPGYGMTHTLGGAAIVNKPVEGAGGNYIFSYFLGWRPTDGVVWFGLGHNFYSGVILASDATVPVGNSVHLAVTFDGTVIRLFINGRFDSSLQFPFSSVYYGPEDTLIGASNFAGDSSGDYLRRFQGRIDEVRIWNYARDECSIRADMDRRLSGAENGLIGYWPFDLGDAADWSGHGHDGVLEGSVRFVNTEQVDAVVVDFDDGPEGAIAADRYRSSGLIFDTDLALDAGDCVDEAYLPHSLPNVLAPTVSPGCAEYAGFGPAGIALSFVRPGTDIPSTVSELSLYSIDGPSESGGQVSLRAYDLSGLLVDEHSLSEAGTDAGVHALHVRGRGIQRVEFLGSPDAEAIDTIIFVPERGRVGLRVSSTASATTAPVEGAHPVQLSELNAGPPPFDPDTWLPVARMNDNNADHDPFLCECAGLTEILTLPISSSDPAVAWPVAGMLTDQLDILNGGPPDSVPGAAEPVARKDADYVNHRPFRCDCTGFPDGAPPEAYCNHWLSGDPLGEPSYVSAIDYLIGPDEVTLNNCESAFYRFTFELPDEFEEACLAGVANVDDQAVAFLNGHQISGTMTNPGCNPDPVNGLADPCYNEQNCFVENGDRFDGQGRQILTWPTQDPFVTCESSWFHPGENELVFAVAGDASVFEPTGLEFEATVAATVPMDCGDILSADPLSEPWYVAADEYLAEADEVTYDNCGSAFYRFTFDLPTNFTNPSLSGWANVDDQGVAFLNGLQISGTMHTGVMNCDPGPCEPCYVGLDPGCTTCEPTAGPADPCYAAQDCGPDNGDMFDDQGRQILTWPTMDPFGASACGHFVPGENELIFAVAGDANFFEPTGLEFEATVGYDLLGDSDFDGDLDLLDFGVVQRCFTDADGGPLSVACQRMDFDADDDVDLDDYAIFAAPDVFTGPK